MVSSFLTSLVILPMINKCINNQKFPLNFLAQSTNLKFKRRCILFSPSWIVLKFLNVSEFFPSNVLGVMIRIQ